MAAQHLPPCLGYLLFFSSLLPPAVTEPPTFDVLERLNSAKADLHKGFAKPGSVDVESIVSGSEGLREVAGFVTRVFRTNSYTLYDESGNVEYELTEDDQKAVQEYMDSHIFVLGDLLPMVMMQPEEVAFIFKSEGNHPLLRRRRLISSLRLSWWQVLTTESSPWAVPLFGGLGAVAQGLRSLRDYEPDPYREQLLLWLASDSSSSPARGAAAGIHLRTLAEPLLPWAHSRRSAFRRACAWLALAEGKSALEAAERQFRSLEHGSLPTLIEAAAEWPIYELLHRVALRAESLEDDGTASWSGEDRPEEPDSSGAVASGGEQWLAPKIVLEYYRVLHVVGALFDAFGVRWWVSHGSLIGALRDGGLSKHAEDLEIDIPAADVEKLQDSQVRAWLGRNGYELSFDPRGRCFKIWPSGSEQTPEANKDDQLVDQSWWLPQQRVGAPALDVYVLENPEEGQGAERHYISNDEFHCNKKVCTQKWRAAELASFYMVPFGDGQVRVPIGAPDYLSRVYGDDWNTTVRPHRWAAAHGEGFDAIPVSHLRSRAAEPSGPLLEPVLPP